MKSQLFQILFAGCIAWGTASAATSDFNFTSCTGGNAQCNSNNISNSVPLVYTSNGITVTATAYATAGTTTGTNTALSAGNVGSYSGYGLGLCSTADGANCAGTAPQHEVDNSGSYEFMLFKFSTPVNLGTITLASFGTTAAGGTIDMDMSYWASSSAFTLSTVPTTGQINIFCGDASQGAANQHACPTSQGNGTNNLGAGSMVDTLTGSNVSYLLVGAYYTTGTAVDTTADYFKIQDLTVSTPEPATFGLLAFSLAGLGLLARKRKLIS
jgi:hypothetical protein